MIDITTNKPFRIQVGRESHAGMPVALSQLDDVKRVLDQHGVNYWVLEGSVSFRGGPATTHIVYSRNNDHQAVQALLDAAP